MVVNSQFHTPVVAVGDQKLFQHWWALAGVRAPCRIIADTCNSLNLYLELDMEFMLMLLVVDIGGMERCLIWEGVEQYSG